MGNEGKPGSYPSAGTLAPGRGRLCWVSRVSPQGEGRRKGEGKQLGLPFQPPLPVRGR